MAKAAKPLTSKTFDGASSEHVYQALGRFLTDVLHGQDDRIAIIVGASMIHMQLEDLLKSLLLPRRGKRDELFDGEQGLSTFSNQTKLAYRLGVLDSDLCSVLDGIRKLRNDYAHDIFAATLDGPPYSQQIDAIAEKYRPTEFLQKALKLEDSPSTKIRAVMVGLSSFLSYLRSSVRTPVSAWAVQSNAAASSNQKKDAGEATRD